MRASRADVDLLLLHAPSVYDFRKRAILYGPVSDLIPSSTVFEMYPLGFLTIVELPARSRPEGAHRESGAAHDEQPALRRAPLPCAPEAPGRRHRPALDAARPRRPGDRAHREGIASGCAGDLRRSVLELLSSRADRLPPGRLRAARRQHRAAAARAAAWRCRSGAAVDSDRQSHLEGRRGIHVNPLSFVPTEPRLCRSASRSHGRDGDALSRSRRARCPSTAGGAIRSRRCSRSRAAPSSASPAAPRTPVAPT